MRKQFFSFSSSQQTAAMVLCGFNILVDQSGFGLC